MIPNFTTEKIHSNTRYELVDGIRWDSSGEYLYLHKGKEIEVHMLKVAENIVHL
jgi:hypothetical protein